MADQLGNLGTLSPEDYAQQQQINRQQKMAEMLMAQNQQPQGQMVSGRFVAPSFFQNIAPLANAYVGKSLLEEGDIKQQKLAEAIRNKQQQQVQGYLGAMQGTPDVMPEIKRDDMGNVMPPIEKASGPNLAEAFKYATNPYAPAPLQAAGYAMLKPEKLAAGESMFAPNFATNKFTPTITNPKEIIATGNNLEAADILGFPRDPSKWTPQMRQAINSYQTMDANRRALKVNVNGGGNGNVGPMAGEGGFNKKGDFISPNGTVFNQSELKKDREVVTSAALLKKALQGINPEDVTASDTMLGDVTQGGFTGYVTKNVLPGGDKTLAAQNKINASGVMQILNNLPPGPASDKDIAQARSTFPGYGNAKALQAWINNTNTMLDQKFGTYQDKYGSMKWYGNANPMQTTTANPVTPQSNEPKMGEVRQGYKFKGGDQYDKNNWVKVQ